MKTEPFVPPQWILSQFFGFTDEQIETVQNLMGGSEPDQSVPDSSQ